MSRGPWQLQIIDDEVVILLAVSRAYRDKSIKIVTASTAEQALSQMDVFNFDLFMLDLDMKDRCSFSLLKTMTERFPESTVILMTTGDVESTTLIKQIEELRPHGRWHLLEKPFNYKKLTVFIERALQERSCDCPDSSPCLLDNQSDKRRCRRFSRYEKINASLPANIDESCQTVPFLATLMDISVGGLCLTTSKQLTRLQAIKFDEKLMHQSGVVVWSQLQDDQNYRAGIRFA
jgi:DNA-binding response OmpR family regulator